ncbi:MAG: TolB-like 6-bladed beta-propeller domain-containing protein [Rikenellaceae bacterium]|nr:TolB-like 6-bladed beta-propeller domain-containing protein [Rikenellaceae bacterium]
MKISVKIVASAFALSALAMSGCGTTPTEEVRNFDFTSFNVIDLSTVEPQRVSPQEMIIGISNNICMVSDSIMAIEDSNASDMQLWLLNVNSGKFAQCLYKGNGPKECLGTTNIWVDNGYLFAGGFHDHKIMRIAVDPDSLTTDIECLAELPEYFIKAITLSDSTLLYSPSTVPDVRYLSVSLDGTVTDTVGEFLLTDRLEEGIRPENHMFQTEIALSPDERHMVASGTFWPMIEIYSVPFDKTIVLNGPIEIDSKIEKTQYGAFQTPLWLILRNLNVCDDGFAVRFMGIKPYVDDSFNEDESLLFFDWEGNPTKRFKLGRKITAFTVDFKSMTLYVLMDDPEPMVVKYALPVSYDELWER